MIEGKELDINSFGKSKVLLDYPCIEIVELNDTLPLVADALEAGNIKLLADHKGTKKLVGSISSSAYNISKLIRTGQKLIYHKSIQEVFELKDIKDYLEVV